MTTRTAMIEQAVLAAGKFGCDCVTLESIAAGASVPLDAARAEFVNTAGLIRAVDDVLNDECSAELDAVLLALPDGATVKEKFSALGRGFLNFAQDRRTMYEAYIAMEVVTTRTTNCDAHYVRPIPRPAWGLCMEFSRELLVSYGMSTDPEELVKISPALPVERLALAHYSAIYGIVHLCTFGMTRGLTGSAKRQLAKAALDNMHEGAMRIITGAPLPKLLPAALLSEPVEPVPAAPETDGEILAALVRASARAYADRGLQGITLAMAAEYAGVPYSRAAALVDGDGGLQRLLSDDSDKDIERMFYRQLATLEGEPSMLEVLKAYSLAYIGFANSDPQKFSANLAVIFGDFVPQEFDEERDESRAFAKFMEIVRLVITVGGGDHSAWNLYTQVFSLWAPTHGLAYMFTLGGFRDLKPELKDTLINAVSDVLAAGTVTRLELNEAALY